MIRYYLAKFKLLIKSEAFRNKPFTVLSRSLILFFSLVFKVKIRYSVNFKSSKFRYTFKPYLKSGLGGRGQFIFREYYEPFLNFGHEIFDKKFNFIDVGCSRGFFSMYLLSLKNFRSNGLCIDPLKGALDDFVEILKINRINRAKIIHGAISNISKKKIEIFRANDLHGYYSIIKDIDFVDKKISNKFKINSYTIDELIFEKKKLKSVDFIKIDAEGAEYEILSKCNKTIKKFKPVIYCEIIRNQGKIFSFLKKKGYKFFSINENKIVDLRNKVRSGNILAFQTYSNVYKNFLIRRGGRAVEGARLESV